MNKRARLTSENANATFTSLKGLISPVDDESEVSTGQVLEVDLSRLRPNPDQPRRRSSAGMSKASIEELAENIREHGVLQPLLVKESGRFLQIVAGERRFRACQLLGLEQIPVRIVEPRDEQDELQISLAENLQRKNLNVLEEAYAFRTLIRRFGLSYRDLARLSGRSAAHVHGRLQLLEYDDVRQAVESKRLGVADAIQLARIPDEAQRKDLLADVQEGNLRGVTLHRQVQVFLGEITPETAREQESIESGESRPTSLQDALQLVESLEGDLDEESQRLLYTIAARAADKLDLRLTSSGLPTTDDAPQPQQRPVQPEGHRAPPPISPESRRIISRSKDYRNSRGNTVVNLIRVYWMHMERRGYVFSPGEWKATPNGDGSYQVSFTYKVDDEPRSMDWIFGEDGSLEPENENAKMLMR